MTFAWPQLLWLLVIPVFQIGWDLSHRRRVATYKRPKILRAEAGPHSLKLSSEDTKSTQASRPRWWLFLGLTCCFLALARPQWGRLDEPVFEQSREIVLAIDLSRSMLAQDVRPTRLDRAKLLIRSLLEKLAGERVGLIVFSGTAFLQSPLSADYEILVEFLPALGPDFLPEGGTNYRALIDAAAGAFAGTTAADRFLIVLSDGEATDEDWQPRLEELKSKGIRVIALGVGTPTGSMIADGMGGFIKDDRGAVVMTKLEASSMQELAQATEGVYRDASSWVDLAALLKETIEAGRKGQFVETNTIRFVERFQWPLAAGLWFLLVSFCFEFPVRPRPRDITLRGQRPRYDQGAGTKVPVVTPPRDTAKATIAGTVAAFLLLGLLSSPRPARAADPLLAPSKPPTAAIPPGAIATDEPMPTPGQANGASLAKLVARLSTAPRQSASDWAEFGRETLAWGARIQTGQQEVPEGPVRDALTAVGLGEKLDAKATDWPKLRQELEDLLKKPEKQDQQQDADDNNKNQDQQQQQQQDQQQQQQQQKQDQQDQQDQKQQQNQQQQPQEKKDGESAFGDMNQRDEPPPPPDQDMQKVGGAEQRDTPPEPIDPSLALPLQKLDQLRNQDSPAQLFQLMEGDKKPTKKSGKDW